MIPSFIASPLANHIALYGCTEAVENQMPTFQVRMLLWWVEAQLCISMSSCSFFPLCQNCDFNCDLRRMWRELCRILIPLYVTFLSASELGLTNPFVCLPQATGGTYCFCGFLSQRGNTFLSSLLRQRNLLNVKCCSYLFEPAESPGAKSQQSDVMVPVAVPCCCQVPCE